MHILYLAHRIPYPPDKGDKIRSYRELRALRELGRLSVACFVDDPADEAYVEPLRSECDELVVERLAPGRAKARCLLALPTREPLSLAWFRSRAMERRIAELAVRRPFDAVLAFSSTTAPFALGVDARRRVLDLCDLDSAKWTQFSGRSRFPMSLVYRLEGRRLARYEDRATARFDTTLLVSESEARELRARVPGADVRVVPNGVDLEGLDPSRGPDHGDGRTLVFCGAMDYFSNVDAVTWFSDAILPRVRAAVPEARFRIVGSNPASAVRELARRDGIEVTGRVPDVVPEIRSADVSVAPLRIGRGVPNKILEALALELPVVTTPNGAAGLHLDDFPGLDVAGEEQAFAEAVVGRLRAAASGRGRHPEHRTLLAERYSWDRFAHELRAIVRGESASVPARREA